MFPDGGNLQVLRAAYILVQEGICTPLLVGPEWKILKRAHDARIELTGMEIVEIDGHPRFDELADTLWSMRQRKGVTKTAARFGVQNIPTIIVFDKGDPSERIVGAKNKREYKTVLDAKIGVS